MLPFVRYTVLLHNLKEIVQSLRPAAFEVLSARAETQTSDCGINDGLLVYIWSPCAKPDETVQILLQRRSFLLQVVEGTGTDFFRLRRSEGSGELSSELVPSVDVSSREIGVPMLSEALQREDERFYFASRAASRRFDGRFVLE